MIVPLTELGSFWSASRFLRSSAREKVYSLACDEVFKQFRRLLACPSQVIPQMQRELRTLKRTNHYKQSGEPGRSNMKYGHEASSRSLVEDTMALGASFAVPDPPKVRRTPKLLELQTKLGKSTAPVRTPRFMSSTRSTQFVQRFLVIRFRFIIPNKSGFFRPECRNLHEERSDTNRICVAPKIVCLVGIWT